MTRTLNEYDLGGYVQLISTSYIYTVYDRGSSVMAGAKVIVSPTNVTKEGAEVIDI
jgi:predicted alternative tryptophan synthase beta-subunit